MVAIDLTNAREVFEQSKDFTCAREEEFALLNPGSLDLVQRFEELRDAAQGDQLLRDSIAGELISSEVEIRSGRCESFTEAVQTQQKVRDRLYKIATGLGIKLGATGTHPWARWQDQQIIDTPHYRRVESDLQYVAWRNNTFSTHVHVGINGADRAVAVSDRLREVLPELLALSANSIYVDGSFAGLHSVRTQIFTKSFPRCGIVEPFGDWEGYAGFVDFLMRANSVIEPTQLWWSVRPHLSFGTVEVRVCDSQSSGDASDGLAALMYACVVQAARDFDEGVLGESMSARLLEENFWRAVRYGLDGKMIKLPTADEHSTRAAVESLLEWTVPASKELGLGEFLKEVEGVLDNGNGAQQQMRLHEGGAQMREVLESALQETERTYFQQ